MKVMPLRIRSWLYIEIQLRLHKGFKTPWWNESVFVAEENKRKDVNVLYSIYLSCKYFVQKSV